MGFKKSPDLLEGALLVARYHYPDIDTTVVYQEMEKLRRNTWLELNNYLTPIEQINIVTSIFYNYYKQKGIEFAYNNPDDYLVNAKRWKQKAMPWVMASSTLHFVNCWSAGEGSLYPPPVYTGLFWPPARPVKPGWSSFRKK